MLTKDEPEKWQLNLKNERVMGRTNLSCKRIVSGSVKFKQQQFSDCFPLQKSTNPEAINCSPKSWVWWYNLQNATMRKYYAACKIHTFRASTHKSELALFSRNPNPTSHLKTQLSWNWNKSWITAADEW
jgi:hypothetical protein